MWDKKMKDVNLIEAAHEPSQTKLKLGSFTNRADTSWLIYNRANFEPSFFQTFFERVSSDLRVTSFLNTPTNLYIRYRQPTTAIISRFLIHFFTELHFNFVRL
ncbi:hypothetical protein Hanom_Chr10g00912101 [Helianthus anomalus]